MLFRSFYMPDDGNRGQTFLEGGLPVEFRVAVKMKDGKTDTAVLHAVGPNKLAKGAKKAKADLATATASGHSGMCVANGGTFDAGKKSCTFTTPVRSGPRWACYLTGIIYGGWCWFIRPQDEDRDAAKEKAQTILGPAAAVEYLGRK